MPPQSPDDPLFRFMRDSQREQSETLKEQNATLSDLRSATARIETRIDGWAQSEREQDATIDRHEARIGVLEHALVRAETAIKITWGVLGLVGSAFASIVGWLLNQH